MGCPGCNKKRRGIETFKIRIKVSPPLGTVKVKEIKKKLEIYAKELINENN